VSELSLNPDQQLALLKDDVREFLREHLSPNTRRAYASTWRKFSRWCLGFDIDPETAPPHSVALYLAELAKEKKKVSTIDRHLAAICKIQVLAGTENPRNHAGLRMMMQGIRRTLGMAQERVDAITPEQLRSMIEHLPDSAHWRLRRIRNIAILNLGFAGAFRRSEIVSLNVCDVNMVEEGCRVQLRKSKTDQEGRGRVVGIPYGSVLSTCPIRSIEMWLQVSGLQDDNPLFVQTTPQGKLSMSRLSGRAIARIVQQAAKGADLNYRFAGHSLRSGLVTAAIKAGKPIHSIQAQTGHTSVNVLLRYVRDHSLFTDNAAANIGL